MAPPGVDFLARRDDLRRTPFAPSAVDLAPGEVLLGVDRFGFSANNVSYAALGEAMRYWDFFRAPDGGGGSRSGASPTSSGRRTTWSRG